jgi:SAM-dependent methyltransferase
MSPVALLKRAVGALAGRFVAVFDVLKRREMYKKYRQLDPFGREHHRGDIDAAVSLLPDVRYGICLDVGTGLGHYAERVAPLCDQVIGIDVCRTAIRRARTRVHRVPNLVFRRGNIRRVTGTPGPVDLIILGDMLYYLGDLEFPAQFERIVDNIVSVLNPGGRILMSHHVSPERPEAVIAAYTASFERRGLTVERSRRFTDGARHVIQAVLRK